MKCYNINKIRVLKYNVKLNLEKLRITLKTMGEYLIPGRRRLQVILKALNLKVIYKNSFNRDPPMLLKRPYMDILRLELA